jgi:hypothetical protein
MKLITLLTILSMAGFGIPNVHAADSAYASAMLYLTSSNSSELATGTASASAGFAYATARPGSMENALLTSGSPAGSLSDETVSGFSDKLTIIDPALTGSSGTLDFNFEVSGAPVFSATLPGVSSLTASASFTAPTVTDDLAFTENSSGIVTSGSDFLNEPQTVVVPFTFGTLFTISLDLDFLGTVTGGTAMVSGTFLTVASTDDVMSAVTLLPASGYSTKSASGANYFTTSAVPEPESLYLALAGLAALPLLGIRRRH